jgi:ABC-type Na+ efflux pump permease subunit
VRLSRRRILAIVRKELREYRRNRSVVGTMAVLPLVFMVQPVVTVFVARGALSAQLTHGHLLLYMLAIPVLVPAAIAASSVVAERQQGTLEPVLTSPIRREEFLLGKALAVLVPSVAIAYLVFAVFLAVVAAFAHPGVASAILQAPDILAQVLFTPLLAVLSIWVGIAISTRASDTRAAQQLSLLGVLPLVLVTSLVAFDVIHPTLGIAIGFAALLIVLDGLGWRIVSAMFDRERLLAGSG